MPNEEKEVITDSTETSEEVAAETIETPVEEKEEVVEKPKETLEQRRARLARQLEQTEKKLGVKKEVLPVANDSDLSSKDIYALVDAKVPREDVEEVVKAAKLLGKSIPDAVDDDVVKTILSRRAEQRRTAEVANTGGSKRVQQKTTDADLIAKASRGEELPDDEMQRVINARLSPRKK